MIEMAALGEPPLVLGAGGMGCALLGDGVFKVLACEADHERSAGSQLAFAHRRPGARTKGFCGFHGWHVVALYYLFRRWVSMRRCWGECRYE